MLDPVSGAIFTNGQASISAVTDANGIAEAGFILGTASGTYTVKAICPPEVCTAGAREVTFTAMAIPSFTDVTGIVPGGCSQVAIGDIIANVDPMTNSFRLYNVPLTMSPEIGLTLPELNMTCNNNAVCPVANAQPMPSVCAGGFFGASRNYGSRSHKGIDLLTENGEAIFSAIEGEVVHVGQFNDKRELDKSWGWTIVIQGTHKASQYYEVLLYGHLDPARVVVKPGDLVAVGQQLATTGVYTGDLPNPDKCPHVHIERRLLTSTLTTIPLPVECPYAREKCHGPDMNFKGNGYLYMNATPVDPDAQIGCNVYR